MARVALLALAPLLALAAVACGGPTEDSVAQGSDAVIAPEEEFCADGTIELEAAYTASTDGKSCASPRRHCVTKDRGACPMLAPLPPSYCANGTRQSTPRWIPSADGKECALPEIHCVTKNHDACPHLMPMPPSWCTGGKVTSGPNYIPSAEAGYECSLPRPYCVTDDASACPAAAE